LTVLILLAGAFVLGALPLAWKLQGLLQLTGLPVAASSSVLSEHELEEISAMSPQDQAMRLIERTINHYNGAAAEIEKRADGWIGKVKTTDELTKLTNVAYFSNDLRVRAAALEIWRVEAGFQKTPEQVDELINKVAVTPDRLYFYL